MFLQRDLATYIANVANLQRNQRRWADALATYRESLVIYEHLVTTDAINTSWQRDLAGAYWNIAFIQRDRNEMADARASAAKAREILVKLITRVPDNKVWNADIVELDRQIAARLQ